MDKSAMISELDSACIEIGLKNDLLDLLKDITHGEEIYTTEEIGLRLITIIDEIIPSTLPITRKYLEAQVET